VRTVKADPLRSTYAIPEPSKIIDLCRLLGTLETSQIPWRILDTADRNQARKLRPGPTDLNAAL
jgi:hypothetical protein